MAKTMAGKISAAYASASRTARICEENDYYGSRHYLCDAFSHLMPVRERMWTESVEYSETNDGHSTATFSDGSRLEYFGDADIMRVVKGKA